MLRNHLLRASKRSPVEVIDAYLGYNVSSTASTSMDPTGGAVPLMLFTLSRRFAATGTPVAAITSTADIYTELDTASDGPVSAFGGQIAYAYELANVENSSSITASINNTNGNFTLNVMAALLLEGLSPSATIHETVVNNSSLATITEDVNVVAGGVLIIYAGDDSPQAVTESGTSLLGDITQVATSSGNILYYAPVVQTGTATIESIITGGSFENLSLISIAP